MSQRPGPAARTCGGGGHKSWAASFPTSAHLIHLHSHLGAGPMMMPILQVRKLKFREAPEMQLPGGGDGIRTLDYVLLDQDGGPQMEGSSGYREYWPQGGRDCPEWRSLVTITEWVPSKVRTDVFFCNDFMLDVGITASKQSYREYHNFDLLSYTCHV